MFLQDGHIHPPDVFFNVDRPRPSQDVTDMYVTMVLYTSLYWGIMYFMPTMYAYL